MNDTESILIIVHPGSACGSADFNLGDAAAEARHALARKIQSWDGHIMIVDGDLSTDLDVYPQIGIAIQNAIDEAGMRGHRVARVHACDFSRDEWPSYAAQSFARHWPGAANDVVLTGAWVEDNGGGCVPAMMAAIEPQRSLRISKSALTLP